MANNFFHSCKLLRFLTLVAGCRPEKRLYSLPTAIWFMYICIHGLEFILNTVYMCSVPTSGSFFTPITFTALPDSLVSLQSFIMLWLIYYHKSTASKFYKKFSICVHPPNVVLISKGQNCVCPMCKLKDMSGKCFAAGILVMLVLRYAQYLYYLNNLYTSHTLGIADEYNLKMETIGYFGNVALSITYFFQYTPHYIYLVWIMFLGVLMKRLLETFNQDLKRLCYPDIATLISKERGALNEDIELLDGPTQEDVDARPRINREALKGLRSRCSNLWQLVNTMNDFLSNIMLAYFATQAAMSLFFIYILVATSWDTDLSLVIWAGLHVTIITTLFFSSTFIISEIHEAAHDGRQYLQDMDTTTLDPDTRTQVLLLVDKLAGPDIGLNIGKFFLIERTVIPTSVGVFLSYLLLLVQTEDPSGAKPHIPGFPANMTG